MSDNNPPGSPNANPDCPNIPDYTLCRVTRTAAVKQPVIDWQPVYDGTGMMTNSDPNTHVSTYSCATCGMDWEVSSVAGEPPSLRKLPQRSA